MLKSASKGFKNVIFSTLLHGRRHYLCYVVTDHNPGDTTGQGVNNFGAPWDVVGTDGNPIG